MKHTLRLVSLMLIVCSMHLAYGQQKSYTIYHQMVLDIERLIAQDQYEEALKLYDELFNSFEFIFLREYKIAAQLAAHLGDEYRAFDYLGLGVANGWTIDEIKKHNLLKRLKKNPIWKDLEFNYDALRLDYEYRINDSLRNVVESIFEEDQKMAWNYLFKPTKKSKNKFIAQEAIPTSEGHIKVLRSIIETQGYPGEQIIGNSVWASTMLGHHNSLSPEYQQEDTLYPALQPKLLEAIERGEMYPYNYAVIDDWYISVKSDRKIRSYGIITPIKQSDIHQCNQTREQLHMRSIELRNQLIDIETKTGINLYLGHGSWLPGKIYPQD